MNEFNTMDELLKTLTPREEKIARIFFGIGREQMSRAFIALHFGISIDRCYQILSRVESKFRNQFREPCARRFEFNFASGTWKKELLDVAV